MGRANKKVGIQKITQSPIGLTLAALAGLLAGVASTTEAVDKIAIWIGIKPNALELAKDGERARFSRELTKAAWYRLYVMRRYMSIIKSNYPPADRDKEWDRYITVLLDWNRDLMVNILSLDQYYGTGKRNEFEYGILPRFANLHVCLLALHRQSPNPQCPASLTNNIAEIDKAFTLLHEDLYCFVSGLPDKDSKCVRY